MQQSWRGQLDWWQAQSRTAGTVKQFQHSLPLEVHIADSQAWPIPVHAGTLFYQNTYFHRVDIVTGFLFSRLNWQKIGSPRPLTLNWVSHLLLRRLVSFSPFSYGAYLHSAPSPTALHFTTCLLLWCLISLSAFSYRAYLHSTHSPKALNENASLKRSCERKRTNFKKLLYEHHIVAIKEHIRVFLLGLACKKKCIVRSRRRRRSMFVAFSFSAKWAKSRPTLVNNRPKSKNFQICSIQIRREWRAKKPSHASVPWYRYLAGATSKLRTFAKGGNQDKTYQPHLRRRPIGQGMLGLKRWVYHKK